MRQLLNKKLIDWGLINEQYWNGIAPFYPNLYNDSWSKLEDNFVRSHLCSIVRSKDNILDMGCGLCLAYSLIKECNSDINYIGLDISLNMLNTSRELYPEITLIHTNMSDLHNIPTSSIDVVISINTSFSFTDDPLKTIKEIRRVIRPNGRILISVLGKWSIRRLLKLKSGKVEYYTTRKAKTINKTKAWVFSVQEIGDLFKKEGFFVAEIKGYNAFAGFLQRKCFWNLNLLISKLCPNLSHTLIWKGVANENK